MDAFRCTHCGAALDIPDDDPRAVDVRCAFCGTSTPIPLDIVKLRSEAGAPPAAPPTGGRGPYLVLALAVPMLAAAGVVAFGLVKSPAAPAHASTPASEGRPATAASAKRPPAPPPDGMDEVAATLRRLASEGCGTVVLAPSVTTGEQDVETRLANNGRCIVIVAAAGDDDNALRLDVRAPSGERLAAPLPARMVEQRVCARAAGQHPTHLVPATAGRYTVAAVECDQGKKGRR